MTEALAPLHDHGHRAGEIDGAAASVREPESQVLGPLGHGHAQDLRHQVRLLLGDAHGGRSSARGVVVVRIAGGHSLVIDGLLFHLQQF